MKLEKRATGHNMQTKQPLSCTMSRSMAGRPTVEARVGRAIVNISSGAIATR